MAGLLRIFNSADDERIYTSAFAGYEDKLIRELKSGDSISIDYTLMQRNVSGGHMRTPWSRVGSGDYSLRIGLFLDATRAQLAYQNTFANIDEFTKRGSLLLTTAEAVAAVASTPFQAACTFEIEITDADGKDRTTYRESVTLKKGLIDASAAGVQPGEVAATQAWVQQTQFPREGANSFIMLTRPSGFRVMVTFNDDGTPNFTLQHP